MKYHYKVHGYYGIIFEGDFETADQALDAYSGKNNWEVTIAFYMAVASFVVWIFIYRFEDGYNEPI